MSADAERLDELRRAFDAAFAAPVPAPAECIPVIALRAGPFSCAVRIAEVGGVVPVGRLAVLPCEEPAMLGVAAVRGALVPVYDLSALAGSGRARAPRWMLVAAGADRVALAFDEIEDYLRVGREQLVRDAGAGAAWPEVVREADRLRPVVSVASLLENLRLRLGLAEKER